MMLMGVFVLTGPGMNRNQLPGNAGSATAGNNEVREMPSRSRSFNFINHFLNPSALV